MTHLGEAAAIATALCWTASSLAFALATARVGGLPVNQFRLLAAAPLLLLLHRLLVGTCWPELSSARLGQLAASGVAGLVLGDLGYFYALGAIGPRISSVLMSTWPAMATAIGWAFLGARLEAAMLLGIAVTLIGVALVLLRAGDGSAWNRTLTSRQRNLATFGALLGALGQAVGSVLVNIATAKAPDLPDGLPGLSAALVRMVAAVLGIGVVTALRGRFLAWRQVLVHRQALAPALLGTAFGPALGVWMSMVALAQAPIGVASTLMATTPIFMMPVAKVAYGARIGGRGVLGTLLAVLGAALLLGTTPA